MMVRYLAFLLLLAQLLGVCGWLNTRTGSNGIDSKRVTELKKTITRPETFDDKRDKEKSIAVEELIAGCSRPIIRSSADVKPIANGLWKVVAAPHIGILEKLLLVQFQVFYVMNSSGHIISNVRYDSIFGLKGWLNVSGTYGVDEKSVGDSISANNNSRVYVQWDNIWWDFESITPSNLSEKSKHVLPELVQSVGKNMFLERFSKFRVLYFDKDMCIFQFELLKTQITAFKLNSKSIDQSVSVAK